MDDKYHNAIDKLKHMGDKDLYNERHLEWLNILQELVEAWDIIEDHKETVFAWLPFKPTERRIVEKVMGIKE